MDLVSSDEPTWMNSLQVTLYVRNPEISDTKIAELQNVLKERIPGYNFDEYHMPILHHSDVCIDGDIFEHKNAHTYKDIHKIKRKFVTKESEMSSIEQ